MKIEVKEEKQNRFLKRKELEVIIEHPEEATPSMVSVQQLLAKQLGSAADKTEIKEVHTAPGSTKSKCLVFVWDEKTVKDLSKKEVKEEASEAASTEQPSKATEQEAEVVAEQVAEDVKEEPKEKVEEQIEEVVEETEKEKDKEEKSE